MTIAPEPYLSACLRVIERAILAARFLSWQRSAPPEQIADLMDAIHNIPSFLQNWETCDVEWLRESLKRYDEKWVCESYLCAVFDQTIKAAGDTHLTHG